MGHADHLFAGVQLLPVIAEYADIETINILASSRPSKISYDLKAVNITASQEVLQ